jgi:phospholipase C
MCLASGATKTTIKHLMVITNENHSFDAYFGAYCQAATGSNPTCNTGPTCCEAAPTSYTPSGSSQASAPFALTDSSNYGSGNYDPPHGTAAETANMNHGQMNGFLPSVFAVAPSSSMSTYFSLAGKYAMADYFFQSAVGASLENNAISAGGKWYFADNSQSPTRFACYSEGSAATSYGGPYSGRTIGYQLDQCSVGWRNYIDYW